MSYCMYLRKSRADLDAERAGEGETLARHRARLTEYAARHNLSVTQVYEEIVSGDSISSRPQMQQLLRDVEQGRWEGVLVVDVERLARGDTIDQGIVAQTFQYTGTRIITPLKVYDPTNEFDQEYFEFGLFMARREYKSITRRMWAGRVASAKEGKWQSPKAPYGYQRVRLETGKGWTLTPDPDRAPIVRMIYDWYEGGIGAVAIANRLNDMGLRTAGGIPFESSQVYSILHNPVYMGKVRWCQRRQAVTIEDGQRVKRRPLNDEPMISDGLHPALVSEAQYERVQKMSHSRRLPRNNCSTALSNQLAGIVHCSICGRVMRGKPDPRRCDAQLYCPTHGCPTAGAYVSVVEDAILSTLSAWVAEYDTSASSSVVHAPENPAVAPVRAQRATVAGQLDKLHDFLEQGVYSTEEFIARRATLQRRLEELDKSIADLTSARQISESDAIRALIPTVRNVLASYHDAHSAEAKNRLLRSVISRADYHKTARNYRNAPLSAGLTLDVYPVLPE